jgi:predicted transcriptional regulator
MKTAMSHTSVEAYHQLIECGKETSQIKIIYNFVVKSFPCSRRDISNGTGIELGAVAGRVNTLVNNGLLIEEKIGVCRHTNKNVKLIEPATKQFKLVLV